MANVNKEKIEDSPLLQVALGSNTSTPSEIQQQLSALLLKRLAKQNAEEEEAERQAREVRRAGMEAVREGMKKKEAEQSQCGHKKPYGESAVVGQRAHSHSYLWLCQYCQKSWKDGELPIDLRINGELVGGPSF